MGETFGLKAMIAAVAKDNIVSDAITSKRVRPVLGDLRAKVIEVEDCTDRYENQKANGCTN